MRLAVVFAVAACNYAPARVGGTADDAATGDSSTVNPDAANDAPPPDALPPCPPAPTGATLFECPGETSCYYRFPAATSWNAARDRCVTEQRGCLVTINNANEQACVFAQFDPISFPNFIYIGYHQADNQANPQAGWSWECGNSQFLAPNWNDAGGEPNDGNGSENNSENCVALGGGGAWIDIGCNDDDRFVCELPR
jgi:hypothetical protein